MSSSTESSIARALLAIFCLTILHAGCGKDEANVASQGTASTTKQSTADVDGGAFANGTIPEVEWPNGTSDLVKDKIVAEILPILRRRLDPDTSAHRSVRIVKYYAIRTAPDRWLSEEAAMSGVILSIASLSVEYDYLDTDNLWRKRGCQVMFCHGSGDRWKQFLYTNPGQGVKREEFEDHGEFLVHKEETPCSKWGS